MGLDTFAVRYVEEGRAIDLTSGDKAAFERADICLCGGMFSGNGCDGSFRGKVYARYIEQVTGYDLYNEANGIMSPAKVRDMADKFNLSVTPMFGNWHERHGDLARFFAVAAQRGLGLANWY